MQLQNTEPFSHLALLALVAFASCLLGEPLQNQAVVPGDMGLGGTVTPAHSLLDYCQVGVDAEAKKVALPISSASDISTVAAALFAMLRPGF